MPPSRPSLRVPIHPIALVLFTASFKLCLNTSWQFILKIRLNHAFPAHRNSKCKYPLLYFQRTLNNKKSTCCLFDNKALIVSYCSISQIIYSEKGL